ncbi:S8 family serine peptidase [Halovenus halobia]|uniref:S8 family serine peptidase n=1 Tax=Halovenus halobia TaxID=3396622 RepID=UPI003F551B8D
MTSRQKNYIASDDAVTAVHGFRMLRIIQEYAPESLYETHRIIIDSGEFKPSNFLKAMSDIKGRSVDIVNISGGKHHTGCKQRCRICKATREVIESGTIVVAGAGNQYEGESKTLYCPALCSDAIAVGSYETRFGLQVNEDADVGVYRTVPQNIYPPNAYWIRDSKMASDGEPIDIAFCSGRGCSEWHSCENNRIEQLSDLNVSFSDGEPDVFAPDHYPFQRRDGTLGIDVGTSFATALVSGALADILSTVAQERPLPQPEEVMEAIRNTPTTVEGTSQRKFNSQAIFQNLLR